VQLTLGKLPLSQIQEAVDVLLKANLSGGTVFLLGNGGSAATASHFACDLAKGAIAANRPRFRVVALTDNVPLMTAWSNDTSYENLFAEQLRNLMRHGDVVIAISGSGNSINVLRAVKLAREGGATTIGLAGFAGGLLRTLVDVPIVVPSDCMEQVEDVHLVLCHSISTALRQKLEKTEPAAPLELDAAAQPWEQQTLAASSTTSDNGDGHR
jgi:D-sedoheptulose 7-phosphate isomerase